MNGYAVRNRNITAHCCVHLGQQAALPYTSLSLTSADHCTNANSGHNYIGNVGHSFSRVLDVIDRTAPHLPHNSPKPFTTSYETIPRKHQVTAFERPSLSPDLISEIVSFNSGYKSQWNGHFKWSGATWLLSEQPAVSRHSVSEQIGQKDSHVPPGM